MDLSETRFTSLVFSCQINTYHERQGPTRRVSTWKYPSPIIPIKYLKRILKTISKEYINIQDKRKELTKSF
jgi:hypothetical protein